VGLKPCGAMSLFSKPENNRANSKDITSHSTDNNEADGYKYGYLVDSWSTGYVDIVSRKTSTSKIGSSRNTCFFTAPYLSTSRCGGGL
jgi:hypothetical protein